MTFSERKCVICGTYFIPNVWNKVCCSENCAKENRKLYNLSEDRKNRLNEYYKEGRYKDKQKQAHKKRYIPSLYNNECVVCGKEFISNKPNKITCSEECKNENKKSWGIKRYQKRKVVKPDKHFICVICGSDFIVSGNKGGRFKTCSAQCKTKASTKCDARKSASHKIACFIRNTLKRKKDKGLVIRTSKYITYKFKDLKVHIESHFKEGMSWDNYGLHGWHIDHIMPLSAFTFFDKDGNINEGDIKEAMGLSNLQPLWAKENLRKANKI